ncbi:MAG: DNA repair protein RecN [Anaerolineales bacterium]|jgi:DNA repair protein RecN (Recombination protein N)
MLVELRIENFAIIDKLDLEFGAGLIIFTGETGAGKSIIIDAVETLLGVRADVTHIRSGVTRSSVEGTFRIMPGVRKAVHDILKEEDLLDDEDYVTLRREFKRAGRNVARVNGRTVNLSLLRTIGELLIDLHGQSEHLSLLRVKNHLDLLDRFSEVEIELSDYRRSHAALIEVRRELNALRQAEKDAVQRAELLSFQVEEITMANLQPGEEEKLKEERTRLANAETLATHATAAMSALDEADIDSPSATDRLGAAVQALESLAKVDGTRAGYSDQAQGLFDGVTELARELGNYLEEIEYNPTRLEEVEERVNLIHNLKRKYGETIPEIIAFGEKAQQDLDAITHAEERMAELISQEGEMLRGVAEKALVLSRKRHEGAEKMARMIETELDDLRMEAASFEVQFGTREDPKGLEIPDKGRVAFDSNGFENVEFFVAPNPGEGMKPLVKIASGGETARLMLALKNVLAKADVTPTLIFDEIDQGIGGRVGAVVGQKLWNLGRQHQVLCITHLAQLAGYGEQHVKVDKKVDGGRTTTTVKVLKEKDRLMELAQMLGEVSEGTLQSANEILQSVSQSTTTIN